METAPKMRMSSAVKNQFLSSFVYMSCDINPVGMDVYTEGVGGYSGDLSVEDREFELYKHIFSRLDARDRRSLDQEVACLRQASGFYSRISHTFTRTHSKFESATRAQAEGSGEVGGSVHWGGNEGVNFSIYGRAEVQDDNGNYVRGEVEHRSDGEGSFSVGGGKK